MSFVGIFSMTRAGVFMSSCRSAQGRFSHGTSGPPNVLSWLKGCRLLHVWQIPVQDLAVILNANVVDEVHRHYIILSMEYSLLVFEGMRNGSDHHPLH